MQMYKCVKTFYSHSLRDQIRINDEINETKYSLLNSEEKKYFIKIP